VKITFITLDISLVGGVERVISNLANKFIENRNNNVKIVSCFKENESPFYDLDEKIQVVYLSERKFSLKNFKKRFISYYYLIRTIKEYMSNNEDDFVIGTLTNVNVLLGIFSNRSNARIIANEHSQYNAHNFFIRMLRKSVYKALDYTVVLNTADFEKFQSFLGDRVKLIPNPLTFSPDGQINTKEKIFFSAGRLHPVKGFKYLIEAFSKANKVFPKWKLIIAGDGEEKDTLEKLIKDKNLQNNIQIIGFQKDISKYFRMASVFCSTSKQECFPMVLLEAMSFGLPVISFNVPSGPRDIICNNEDGFLIEPFSIDDYSKKMINLMRDNVLRKKMGLAAMKNIERYSIDEINNRWSEILKK